MKFKVLPTKEILHGNRWFHAGQEIEMTETEAKRFKYEIAPAAVSGKSDGVKPKTRKSNPKRR